MTKVVNTSLRANEVEDTLAKAGITFPIQEDEVVGIGLSLHTDERSVIRCGAHTFDEFLIPKEGYMSDWMLLCIVWLRKGAVSVGASDIADWRVFSL